MPAQSYEQPISSSSKANTSTANALNRYSSNVSGAGCSRYFESSAEIGDYNAFDRQTSSSNLNLTNATVKMPSYGAAVGTDDINTNKRLPMMLTLAMSKCPSSIDIQQHPSSTVNHQMSSFKGGAAAIDYYRSNRPHQLNAQTSSSRFNYNSIHKQTAAPTDSNAAGYSIDSSDEHNPTAMALNGVYQCNDAMCNNNSSRLFNRRSLTLMRPPSSSSTAATATAAAPTANAASNVSNLYKDQYLRQFTSKLPKLQSFISTPDLTSESSRADDINCTDELDELLALMPPPPPAMPLLTSKTLSATTTNSENDFARPDVIQLHTFRCFHHHKHNQAGAVQTMPSKSTTPNANDGSGKQTEPASGKV